MRGDAQRRLEDAFAGGLRMFGADLPTPTREHRFDDVRFWRFDFAWIEQRVAVEIHGGIWLGSAGGHTSGRGVQRDAEKSRAAQLQGWVVLPFTGADVALRCLPETIDVVRRALATRKQPIPQEVA